MTGPRPSPSNARRRAPRVKEVAVDAAAPEGARDDPDAWAAARAQQLAERLPLPALPGGSAAQALPGSFAAPALPGGSAAQALPGSFAAPALPGGSAAQALPGSFAAPALPGGSAAPAPPAAPAPLLPLPGGPADDALRALAVAAPAPGTTDVAGAALLLPTSGSTGAPRLVVLDGAAVVASARGGEQRLGGPAHWLLALPLAHVAGWNVLARGAVAGTAPTALPPGDPFTAAAFRAGAERLLRRADGGPARTALVPTQLVRLLDDAGGAEALAALDAVLLGGAAAPRALLDRAAAAGVRVVTTYGSTETCGGCVYDGAPLPGARVRLEGAGDDGAGRAPARVLLGGAVLARGLVGEAPFAADADGVRWVPTADAGVLEPAADGSRLRVLGRLDDVVVTGGEKVVPAAVEEALAGVDGVAEVLVVGVPDPRWGSAVVALVRAGPPAPPALEDLRAAASAALGRAAAPRALVLVDDLPRRALGKPDRRAAAALAQRRLGAGSGSAPDGDPDGATPEGPGRSTRAGG
ncbi:AMP-binding protein [Pseudokineococcus marinus]